MPTYEYECLKCKHKFEAFQGINEAHLKECPACGKSVKRLISMGAGIIFKGSGFYATDYRNKSYKDKEREESKNICPATNKPCQASECPKTDK